MVSRTYARPLTIEDGAALRDIDQQSALRYGLEPALTQGSLSFYARTGHAFVAVCDDCPRGFVLAQAIWNGTRPTVVATRLAVLTDPDDEARAALLAALTKSAYDAAVYDLQVQLSRLDKRTAQVLISQQYRDLPLSLYGRVLGSRGQQEGAP